LRPEAQKLIDEYTSQPRAVFVKTDVVMWDQLTNMFDVAEKEFGGADIVCFLPASRTRPLDFYNTMLTSTSIGMPRRRHLRTTLDQLLAPTWNPKVQR
jgi:NAD(P)-dependent dehydrogenase (short-subunit alcohol dehydrogenase family)